MDKIISEDLLDIFKKTRPQLLKLQGKKILITGASGMLASYLVFTLLEANRSLFKKPCHLYLIIRKKIKPFGYDKNITYLHLDVASKTPNVKDIDYIIHAASKAAPKLFKEHGIDTINANISGLMNLLNISGKKLHSFLYFSSGEIYGSIKDNKPVPENYLGITDHLNDRACYVESKKMGETICLNYFKENKVPVKIVRIFHTFGPGLNLNDGRVFSDFIANCLARKNIEIKGDKNTVRSYLYIKDAAIMFFKVLLSGVNGEVYNVGSHKNIASVEELAKIICSNFNKHYHKKIKVIVNKTNSAVYQNAAKAVIPDIHKFIKNFAYEPDTTLDEMVGRTIAYYLKDEK